MRPLRFGRMAPSAQHRPLHEAMGFWASDWQRVDADLSPNWDRSESLADITIEGQHVVPRREGGA